MRNTDPPPPQDGPKLCAVCGRVLDHVVGLGLTHSISTVDDHPAVPVEPGDVPVVGKCDFCFAPDPPLEVPARDFAYPGPLPPGAPNASRGNWSCCEPCGVLIRADRWNALLRRVALSHERRYGTPLPDAALAATRRLHRRLRANITGPVRPSTWPPHADPGTGPAENS